MHTIHSRSPECGSVLQISSSSSSSLTKFYPKSKIKFLNYAATIHQSRASFVWNRPPPEKIIPRRRRFVPSCFLQLPFLPFPLEQVLVPSESKTLHLFEARYLGLLEESFIRKKRLFVHFILDPVVISSTSEEASFSARYGCLVQIEKVERLDVGALVSIRGIGRVTIVKFEQAEPFLKGVVIPLQDNVSLDLSKISSQVLELKESLKSLNSLEIKLKAAKEALLQTQTTNSLLWAEKEPSLDCDKAFIPSLAERVSFAAFQPVSGSSESEKVKLQGERLKAMDAIDTRERLDLSLKFVRENISMLAAKLAIQSLELR
ncbi:hypothetical protein LguiB_009759 [Lonicera macranthoides]